MDIDYLREFVELSHHRTLTDAASSLHVHQSTLSKHLIMLEKEFGATLIDRSKKGLCLTAQGYFFMGCATAMIDLHESTLEGLRRIAESDGLRLGWEAADAALGSLLSMATVLYNDKGHKPIRCIHGTAGRLLDDLAQEKIDVAVTNQPEETVESYGFERKLLLENPAVAVLEKTHRLANQASISIQDLENETLIKLLSEDAQAGWNTIHLLCEKRGFEPKTQPVLTPSTIENITVPLNNCILLFPGKTREINFLSQLRKYVCIPVSDEDAVFPVFAAWNPGTRTRVEPFLMALDEALAIMASPA